jgi:hypothetical protein
MQQNVLAKMCEYMGSEILVQCNNNTDVYRSMIDGQKYIFELPDLKTVLLVVCDFAACRAADIRVITEIVDGKIGQDDAGYYISYQYDSFDSINFSSFTRRDKCIIYTV